MNALRTNMKDDLSEIHVTILLVAIEYYVSAYSDMLPHSATRVGGDE